MIGKAGNLLVAMTFILLFCSREDTNTVPEPEIHTEKYQLEITSDFKIKKLTFFSYDGSRNYVRDYFYYNDSIVTKSYYQAVPYFIVYFLNDNGMADSSQTNYDYGYSFSYDSNGYLISRRYRISPQYEYTDTYEYKNGNLTKVTFDPQKPSLTGKYVSYTYNTLPNVINITDFTGPWLGKLNKNLVKSSYVGGSMSDVAPCSNYEYKINTLGLVETMIILSCSTNKVRTIISFEYKIVD